ncbi:YbaL family putative K(+) efflux transporter [Microbulbifer thermotolerans]|uniref:Kef family K(+) transporter n=1 Tax=Microbulbifer thermotolerans TaxID=252514 RepID=A0A143HNQ7_MICTH|nr:YbaL family putative K(+) efflux transporter [Microbulbifer thermotolerans]AMX03349.1 sodium:proton antiporter [Microbulbifer thermotolerans]MCX2781133.1 Kef family K(+) transporter [Microbulbifer thermotolerans]MCX2782984.1 Kef family K(+) transporter [Microbulbifer thermotolerans]MCX2795489.1 Kef family K(+) transporter [Microbulbifer thermotolerans]MCX2801086.1 Kef family K(+) transporter [Microbulbifer thermotolerans]
MHHDITLITTLSAALGLALLLGFAAVRLHLPALVGYLIAGILIGPATPGFVADIELSQQLAEIGVILIMFGVGLHFSIEDLMSVRRIAIIGALAQIAVATALGAAVASYWGWPPGAAVVFGLSLSVASTVVLLRALEARGLLDSINGRIAVGWLVVEDLVMVLVLVVLPPLAGWLGGGGADVGEGDLSTTVLWTLVKVTVFVLLMLVVGRRLFPWFLWRIARTGSRELFTLCVIVFAMGIAYSAAEVFGVSFALGAFFAGSVLRGSSLSHRAADESLPLRDAFAVLFFVSVGMLFDPGMLLEEPLRVLAVLAIIMLGKTLAAFILVLLFRYPLNTALTVSASLAQIGEFSFILAGLGASLNLLTADAQNLILAGALLSIALNPLLFNAVEPLQRWIRSRSRLARVMERSADPLAELPATVSSKSVTGHALLVGYGRIGQRICDDLIENGISLVVAEQNREIVESLRSRGIPAVSGDAAEPEVLIQAHVARARILVITTPDAVRVRKMIETARILNPAIEIAVRAYSDEDAMLLRREQVGNVLMGERELALGMSRCVKESFGEAAREG